MSGSTDDAIIRHGVIHKSATFLGKPFSPAALVRKLRDVIDGPPTVADPHSAAAT